MILDINTDAIRLHTLLIKKMSRSAIPVAVRTALNSTAFDVKKNTMPAIAEKTFEKRKPNFFKANSKVDMATGLDIRSMRSIIGFVSLSGTNHAVDDLEQQEHGGGIGGRSFIALAQARVGSNYRRNVRRQARISDIGKNIVDSSANKSTGKEQFIRSAIYAGKGGYILGNRVNGEGNKILYQVRSIVRIKGDTVVKLVPLYAVKKSRIVQPKATHFMNVASYQSGSKLQSFYVAAAQKQIDKIRK